MLLETLSRLLTDVGYASLSVWACSSERTQAGTKQRVEKKKKERVVVDELTDDRAEAADN